MWVKLTEIIEARVINANQQQRTHAAKVVNTLYGAMTNCQVAFIRLEQHQSEMNFANFAFAIDALISTLQNVSATQFEIFDPELAEPLRNYALGNARLNAMAQPRELVKFQIMLLRKLVDVEADLIELAPEEFGGFSEALTHLGRLIRQNYTLEELFGAA
jgi:hypothetical protein